MAGVAEVVDLDFAEALAAVESADAESAASAAAAAAAAPAAAPASKIVQLSGGKRPPITSAAALAASVSARAATEALLQSRLTSARNKFSASEMAEALKRYEDRGKKWQLSLELSAAEDPELWWSVEDEYMDLYLTTPSSCARRAWCRRTSASGRTAAATPTRTRTRRRSRRARSVSSRHSSGWRRSRPPLTFRRRRRRRPTCARRCA